MSLYRYHSVKDLRSLALERLCKYLLDVTHEIKKDVDGFRKYSISYIPALIRTAILDCTKTLLDNDQKDREIKTDIECIDCPNFYAQLFRDHFNKWLVIVDAMLDDGVNRLPEIWLSEDIDNKFYEFVSTLSRCNPHLNILSLKLQTKNKSPPPASIDIFQKTLQEGLASKLVSLKLVGICDNSLLEIIGKHALSLKHLDVSRSWNVDEIGIKNLLFKKGVHMITDDISNDTLCQRLSQIYGNELMLNPCCFTLEVLNIENTSAEKIGPEASFLMVLACIKSLKSFGVLNDLRCVGDYLVAIWENFTKTRVFELTELKDLDLNANKVTTYKECLPHLEKLSTRLSCVRDFVNSDDPIQKSPFWNRIHKLEIELDFSDANFNPVHFAMTYGHNLSEITFVNRKVAVDVANLVKSCPNIQVLDGTVRVYDKPHGQFTKLKSIGLNSPTATTIEWFLENCPCLEVAKFDRDVSYEYWNTQVFERPPLIMCNNIKRLDISFSQFLFYDDPHIALITFQTVNKFIDNCSKLQYLGTIGSWKMSESTIREIKAHVKKMHIDIEIQ